jgi:hypothetical protein
MRYTVRRFIPDRFVGCWSGEEIGYSESINESRELVPFGFTLKDLNDKTNYPEEIVISDDLPTRENLQTGERLFGVIEIYVKKKD